MIVVVNTVYICLWLCAVTMFRFLRHLPLFVRTLFPPLNGCCRVHVRVCQEASHIIYQHIPHRQQKQQQPQQRVYTFGAASANATHIRRLFKFSNILRATSSLFN